MLKFFVRCENEEGDVWEMEIEADTWEDAENIALEDPRVAGSEVTGMYDPRRLTPERCALRGAVLSGQPFPPSLRRSLKPASAGSRSRGSAQ